jgi:hypothetical protein
MIRDYHQLPMLLLHILIAFFVGGGFIALLSLLAERATKQTAGLILSLPSTAAIGFFFIGLTASPESIAAFALGYPSAGAACYLGAAAYAYLALRIGTTSIRSMTWCFLSLVIVWFVFSLPMLLMPKMPIALSLGIWTAYVLLSHYLLAVRPVVDTAPVELHFTRGEIFFRSILAGTLIASVVFLSKTLGPVWGGLMSAFPAAISSTLLIVHRSHPPRFLFHVLARMPAAAPTFLIYVFLAAWTFPRIGVVAGTIVTYAMSVGFLVILNRLSHRNKPQ